MTTIGYACSYCQNVYPADVHICPECNEYDGMLPLSALPVTFGMLEEVADYETLAKAFYSLASDELVARIYNRLK